MSQRTP